MCVFLFSCPFLRKRRLKPAWPCRASQSAGWSVWSSRCVSGGVCKQPSSLELTTLSFSLRAHHARYSRRIAVYAAPRSEQRIPPRVLGCLLIDCVRAYAHIHTRTHDLPERTTLRSPSTGTPGQARRARARASAPSCRRPSPSPRSWARRAGSTLRSYEVRVRGGAGGGDTTTPAGAGAGDGPGGAALGPGRDRMRLPYVEEREEQISGLVT